MTLFDGGSSFGENINYDPDFDIVKAEVGKLGNIDYELLEEKSLSLLREKSKDIRLFSFLGLCYLKREQWEQFCDVFEALAQLIEKDFAALHPLRPRAKQLALKWISEDRFMDVVEISKPPENAHDDIKRLVKSLTALKQILEKEYPNGAPFPLKLFNCAQKWEKTTEPKEEKPAEQSPPPATSSSTAAGAQPSPQSSAPATSSASVPATDQFQAPKDALDAVRKSAMFLIEKEPKSSAGYRLIRAARWGIDKAPPHEGGQTRLDPLPPQRRTFIHSLLGKGDFKVALDTVEKTFSSGPTHFWLDLQRIAYTAASQLGSEYSAVSNAILTETALFIQKVPDIKDLSYSDGTPFCDPATLDWLNGDVAELFSFQSGTSAASGSNDQVAEERKEVNGLASSGKIEDALDYLMSKIAENNCPRDNFRRRLAVSSVMINAKRVDVALHILEHLNDLIDKHSLDVWEPSLAVEALNLLLRSYALAAVNKQGNAAGRLMEKRELIMKKLSYIDPKAAYKQK
ncbi:type VI secretion system protein TssA [Chitinispirillales bacterium ANBcel5]|uniref:type VI secretion system protein TssA n=1 Tax=Cellulosispirillum alkaliphilum TaxID=3039283 RepID=UPI002A4FAB91|nr:type VI secretion system protein TssA [Chitinispirillales bacterium ANBcel5]